MAIKKRRRYFYTLLVVFFVLIPVITLYTSGYRISSGFKIVETGGIYVYAQESGTEIYINNKKEKKTGLINKDIFVQNLTPGTYTILVSKEGFWPWSKEIVVEERKVAEAVAFLIPKEPKGETIPKTTINFTSGTSTPTYTENKEYEETLILFTEKIKTDNSTTTEKTSKRGRVTIYGDTASISAKWLKDEPSIPPYFCRNNVCEFEVSVFEALSPIRQFDFYPGREDVIIISIENGIYAIEIDTRKNQNFQPIYKGADPSFFVDGKKLYIKDGQNIFKISL